jgi:NAD+ synthase
MSVMQLENEEAPALQPAEPSGRAEFSSETLRLDAEAEAERICAAIREQVTKRLRRRGIVLGLSGGIDSSVTAGLAARALGPANVLAVLMPEKDSESDSLRLGHAVARTFGLSTVTEDIEPMLTAAGCYTRRDECIRKLVPDFGPGWGCKVVIANALKGAGYNITSLVVQSPDGKQQKMRMPLDVYLGIVAATNMKQRTRKQIEYYHADRLNYAVAGTPNRLEYDQGFFVKNGDGAADFKPIAHLYKSQVYRLAEHLGVPEEIRRRPPTTETFSLPQTQEEFYFGYSYERMDELMWGHTHGVEPAELAPRIGMSAEEVEVAYAEIERRRKATAYLHAPAVLFPPED